MTLFADYVVSIVHRFNCSSRSAQKALAANYVITRITIYAVRTFRVHPVFRGFTSFRRRDPLLPTSIITCTLILIHELSTLHSCEKTSDAQKFERLLTHFLMKENIMMLVLECKSA